MADWRLAPHDRCDKRLVIKGPLTLYVDYDDVDTEAVDEMIPEFLRALNEHFRPPVRYTCPEYYGDDVYQSHEKYPRYLEEVTLEES